MDRRCFINPYMSHCWARIFSTMGRKVATTPSCSNGRKARWLVQIFLLTAVQHGVRGMQCPSSCVCKFDDILEHNSASCHFSNTKVNISWGKSFGNTDLELFCSDEAENHQHDCSNLPQFHISSKEAALIVEGCAPSIMRCVHKIFAPFTTITYFDVKMMAGSFTTDDLTDFDHVEQAEMHLKNGGSEMNAIALNTLKSLKRFTLKDGNLKLPSNALNLPKLEFLSLQQNNIQDLPPNAFNGLPKLRFLYIFNNTFKHLDTNFFRGLDSLTDIYFVRNSIITIDPAAFSNTKLLSSLVIASNRLKLVPNGLFVGLNKLHEITISNNFVEMTLDTHAFANLPYSVRKVRVGNCNIKYLPEYVFNGSANIDEIVLLWTQIKSLPPKIFATNTGLRRLDLRRNGIQSLPDGIFSELELLEAIDLSHNYLSVLRGDIFRHNINLKEVKLKNNKLTYIDPDIFKGMNILILDLSWNKLQRIFGKTPLEWSTGLFYLNDNELTVFEDWFGDIEGLTQLHLSGNKITTIKASQIYKFKDITRIYLQNNSITEIVSDISISCATPSAADEVLYLANNPLRCEGIVATLLKQWHDCEVLLDYEEITCDRGQKYDNHSGIGTTKSNVYILFLIVFTVFA